MIEIAIRVHNLSKLYKIGVEQRRYDTLRDQLTNGLKTALRRGDKNTQAATIWALKNINFEVPHGEIVGIIGRNGAGKSTLLKILSRITVPTIGCAEIYGRVSSLLEVGTGFHQELTGRENIYLNGAILGMRKSEIKAKFDEIVDFSGVGKFLDTPIKRYSSGMKVRLAFSVAAHLEPEIVIIDEVLAVGDADFQKKCMGKMEDVVKGGRTVLFVSHNMSAISRLCPSAMLLDEGRILLSGPSSSVIEHYMNPENQQTSEKIWNCSDLSNKMPFRPMAVRILGANASVANRLKACEPFLVEFEYEITEPIRGMRIALQFSKASGDTLFASFDADDLNHFERFGVRRPGRYVSRCHVPANLFNTGAHLIGINAGIPKKPPFFFEPNAASFIVDEMGIVGNQWGSRGGLFRPALDWDIESKQP